MTKLVSRWVREELPIAEPRVAPSHAWRHWADKRAETNLAGGPRKARTNEAIVADARTALGDAELSALLRAMVALIATLGMISAGLAKSERIGSFLIDDEAPELIVLAGELTPTSPLDFKTALLSQPKATTLVLSSGGGNVTAGLLLADEINLRGFDTYIPPDTGCYSACSYIFFAGKSRLAEGELGVHQFSGPESGADLAVAQYTVSSILGILGKFEVPPEVINRMLRTDPSDMYVFSKKEIADLGINRLPDQARAKVALLDRIPEQSYALDEPGVEADAKSKSSDPSQPEPPAPDEPTPLFAIYRGLDFYGADIDKMRAASFGECASACLGNKQCAAVTYNSDPKFKKGPNCFVKSDQGRTEPYEMAISGTFVWSDQNAMIKAGKQSFRPETFTASEVAKLGNELQ